MTELLVLFDDPKIKLFKEAKELLKFLGWDCEESETWLKEPDSKKSKEILERVIGCLEKLCRMLSSADQL